MKRIAIIGASAPMFDKIVSSKLIGNDVILINQKDIMEPKIKSKKELVIKAKESEEQIEESINNDDFGAEKRAKLSANTIPMSNKQKKARAANKRAKVARKVNRK